MIEKPADKGPFFKVLEFGTRAFDALCFTAGVHSSRGF